MSNTHSDSENMRAAKAVGAAGDAFKSGAVPFKRVAPPRPALSGCRLSDPGGGNIFLVDRDGYRRRVPNYTTYSRLFRDWSGLVETPDIEGLPQRADFAASTVLVRGDVDNAIYLLDQGRRRTITSSAVMNKYWFSWDRVSVIRQLLIEHMPLGDDWE